jgi:hypothetical protein
MYKKLLIFATTLSFLNSTDTNKILRVARSSIASCSTTYVIMYANKNTSAICRVRLDGEDSYTLLEKNNGASINLPEKKGRGIFDKYERLYRVSHSNLGNKN